MTRKDREIPFQHIFFRNKPVLLYFSVAFINYRKFYYPNMPHHAEETRKDLGREHPWGDAGQNIFFLIFLATWVLDSFVVRWTIFLATFIPFWIALPFAGALLVVAVYLVRESNRVVFLQVRDPPRVIDSGVFAHVRHPMYLGFLLFLLGLVIATMSMLSLAVWGAFFLFYDHIATFEEQDLEQKFGEVYARYREAVPKWIPRFRLHSHGETK